MIASAFDKSSVLRSADEVRRTQVFVPEVEGYVPGFVHEPVEQWPYEGGIEPVVNIDGFNDPTDDAWLTVNQYNAVVLNSRNMLIADIDFGAERLNEHAGAIDEDDLLDAMGALRVLDTALEGLFTGVRFDKESYRVYRTHSGCRVICTSRTFEHPEDAYFAKRFMVFLKADRKYVTLCDAQECYRARLTPKPWRMGDGDHHVCNLVDTIGSIVLPCFESQLAMHDEMTLARSHESSLA